VVHERIFSLNNIIKENNTKREADTDNKTIKVASTEIITDMINTSTIKEVEILEINPNLVDRESITSSMETMEIIITVTSISNLLTNTMVFLDTSSSKDTNKGVKCITNITQV
jgi:hypothetical protein